MNSLHGCRMRIEESLRRSSYLLYWISVSAYLVKIEASKARLYKDYIGWLKTQLLKAPTSTTSPR